MGYSLDQLLDETGVSDLGGARSMNKTAAEKPNFSKLAERCRRAVDATPAERSGSADRDLAEKTAAIAVIGRTLAEIRAIEGDAGGHQKTAAAASSFSTETFIKAALEAGHPPEAIAGFLEKNAGILDRIKGGVREMRAGHALGRAERIGAKAEAKGGEAFRRFQDHVRKSEGLGESERDALVSKLRVRLGDEKAAQLVADHPAYKNLPSAKGLKKAAPPAATGGSGKGPGEALGMNIGGAHMGVTGEQLGKLKKPAALVGAGYLGHRALTGGGAKDDKKKSGVVVVNS